MPESLLYGLILVDVAATLAGNYQLWTLLSGIQERLTRLETEHKTVMQAAHGGKEDLYGH